MTEDVKQPSSVVARPPKWQFSLRTFVIFVVVSSALAGWTASIFSRGFREKKIVTRLQVLSARVYFDYQFDPVTGEKADNALPPGPRWIRHWFGEQFLAQAVSVELVDNASLNDLEFLKGLRKLKRLTLFNCDAITDVDSLALLPQLEFLDLGCCDQLSNIESLRKAKHLQHVDLYQCGELTNVSSLQDLPGLSYLNLASCKKLTELDCLSHLQNLKKLDLMNCKLTNVDCLQGLNRLEELYLDDCQQLANLDGLKNLTRLQKLYLRGCRQLTRQQIDELRKQLPATNIIADD